jgi:hypothetical protein
MAYGSVLPHPRGQGMYIISIGRETCQGYLSLFIRRKIQEKDRRIPPPAESSPSVLFAYLGQGEAGNKKVPCIV